MEECQSKAKMIPVTYILQVKYLQQIIILRQHFKSEFQNKSYIFVALLQKYATSSFMIQWLPLWMIRKGKLSTPQQKHTQKVNISMYFIGKDSKIDINTKGNDVWAGDRAKF